MRNQKINQKSYYALNFIDVVDVRDNEGNLTGEKRIVYSEPIEFKTHISGASGVSIIDSNGINIDYDKSFLITVGELEKLGFNENTVFFIDTKPSYDKYDHPLYDYKVRRIRDTLNEVLILLQKVRNN